MVASRPGASPTDRVLRVELLGGFRVSYAGQAVADSDWRLTKARSLLKLLALTETHRLHREHIVDLLWPDLEPGAANNNFHQALFSARRALATVVPTDAGTPTLLLQRQVLSLEPPDGFWVDVEAFEQQAKLARQLDEPSAIHAALGLYAGELLPDDRYEDWAAERRDSLRELFVSLLLRLESVHEARHELTPAIDAARQVVAVDAANEDAHVALMRLYAQAGRIQQATRQFQRLRAVLAEELDAEPAPETMRLYREIVERRPVPGERRPPQAAVERAPVAHVVAPIAPAERPETEESAPFVGRVAEVAELRSAAKRAIDGRPQIVMIAGEAGIGKTRTVERALADMGRDAWVVWARCHDGEGAPDFWPWIQVAREIGERLPANRRVALGDSAAADLASIVPELKTWLRPAPQRAQLTPEQERFRLCDGMSALLTVAAALRPLIVVVDDLHWADRASLHMLDFVAQELRARRVALIGTYREDDLDRHHPLERTLAHVSRHSGCTRLRLRGLEREHVAHYSALTLGRPLPESLVDAIYQQTEGNPFFMTEVVRLLSDEHRLDESQELSSWRIAVPRGVRETILLRMDRLSDEALQVLTVAAACGREFDHAVVQAACDLPAESVLAAFEAGLAARILTEPGDMRFAFSHALIRETLYQDVSSARRMLIHHRIGEAIERVHAADIERHLGDLAHHFVLAAPLGDAEKAVRWSVRAGAQALGRVAYSEAVGHFEHALQVIDRWPQGDDELRCEVLVQLADARVRAGETLEARAAYSEAAAIARRLGVARLLARAALGAASVEEEVAVDDRASLDLLEAALAQLDPGDVRARALVLSRLSQALFFHDPHALERRRALSDAAVDAARRSGDAATLATALLARFAAHWQPENLAERLRDTEEVVRVAHEANDPQLELTGHAWRIYDLLETGDMPAVDREIEAYAGVVDALRLPYNRWSLSTKRALRALMRGPLDEAEALVEETMALGRRPAPRTAEYVYLTQQFVIARERGTLDALLPRLLQLELHGPIRSNRHLYACLLLLIDSELGNIDDARQRLNALAAADFEDIPRDFHWLCAIALLSEAAAKLGDRRRATRLHALLAPFADRNVSTGSTVVCFGPAARYLAHLAACLGLLDEADKHFQAALAATRAMGFATLEARSAVEYGAFLRARRRPGDLETADEVLRGARDSARVLGLTGLEGQVEGMLSCGSSAATSDRQAIAE